MADSKISNHTELAARPASGDLLEIVDVSDTSMAATGTNKKIQFTNLATLKSKLISFTRDMTAASGNVAYTGVGFTPTAIIFIVCISGTHTFSIGVVDSSRGGGAQSQYSPDTFGPASVPIDASVSGGTNQYAVVASYDADGFTLTWTKQNSPTGTATIKALCFA